MLILEQDALEVIILSFLDHLRPAISGEIQFNENKSSLFFGLTSGEEVAFHLPFLKANNKR